MRTGRSRGFLLELMTVAGPQGQPVDFSQLRDLSQGFLGEGRLALERVQDHALEQVAKRHVFELGQRLQYFQQAFFDSYARLHSFDFAHVMFSIGYLCTKIHQSAVSCESDLPYGDARQTACSSSAFESIMAASTG